MKPADLILKRQVDFLCILAWRTFILLSLGCYFTNHPNLWVFCLVAFGSFVVLVIPPLARSMAEKEISSKKPSEG